ncbi:MAG: glycosyltransferase [Betaproteobacteria bacterium]|nr:glycosyltransferase [Betaproteobacteria bacterium]
MNLEHGTRVSGKRIVFATFGSLGDLHPYLALAQELKRRSHRPLIATFEEYREPVAAAGIAFAAMRPAMAGFGDPRAIMERLVDPWRGPEHMVRKIFMPHLRESYEDLARACEGADLLVTHPLAFTGPLLAEQRGLRWVSTVLSPMSLFSAIDPPLFPAAAWLRHVRKLGVAPYRLVFSYVRRVVRRWEEPLHRLRAELGLPSPGPIAQFEGQYSPRVNLALFSRLLAAPQTDWPVNTVVCGFPRYDGTPPDSATRDELEAFLAAGEPPIAFGLGSSAVMVAGKFWRDAIAAARALGHRAVLLTGAPPEELGALPASVKAFQYLPYSAVFPRAAAVVHPGGIGTLAQALASGRPQLVVPVAFDQPDNARRTVKLGIARAVPFRKANAAAMAAALQALLASAGCAARAETIGEKVRRDDGARAACDELERAAANT